MKDYMKSKTVFWLAGGILAAGGLCTLKEKVSPPKPSLTEQEEQKRIQNEIAQMGRDMDKKYDEVPENDPIKEKLAYWFAQFDNQYDIYASNTPVFSNTDVLMKTLRGFKEEFDREYAKFEKERT